MKIGLLLPRSGIFPSLGFDLFDGLSLGLKELGLVNTTIITASIDVGGRKDLVYQSCEKLILEGAEVVFAYINPDHLQVLTPLFEIKKKYLVILDSGYQYLQHKTGKRVFSISLHGAMSARLTSNKAQKMGFKEFVFSCSYYDSGYRIAHGFSSGLNDGSNILFNYVAPLKKKEFTLFPVINFLKSRTLPTALFASFSGDMAEDFYATDGVADYPVFVSPFMLEETLLSKIVYKPMRVFGYVPWSRTIDNVCNRKFVEVFEQETGRLANYFSLLGWEASLFASLISSSTGDILLHNHEIVLESPRGKLRLDVENNTFSSQMYFCEVVNFEKSGYCGLAINDLEHIPDVEFQNQKELLQSFPESVTSWHNSYLCID